MSGLSSSRRVLLVGGEGVVLYAPSGKGVNRETSIAWEVPNFDQQLVEALSERHQSKSVLVLFDGGDQTYRKEENIPKLSIFDRPGYVKRKLSLAFPSYPIRASLEIKPQKKKGRRGVKEKPSYLFAALPETDQLDRIGSALYEAGSPVAGFGLLPVESAALVSKLSEGLFGSAGKPSRWAVLLGQHETGGLRQVVVKDGNLALARLTPTTEAGTSGPGWVEAAVQGFKETLAYISRYGYSPDDGLDLIIICGDIEKQFFDQKGMPVAHFKCLNVSEALRMIGAKSFGLEKSNFADALHAAWAGKRASLKMPVRVPSIHRIMAPRFGARVASFAFALTFVAIIGVSARDYQTYVEVEDEIGIKQNSKSMLEREYAEETKVFDQLPVKPEVVKGALSVKGALEKGTVDISPYLSTLKNTLGSDIKLSQLSFEHTPPADLLPPQAGARPTPPNPQDRGRVRIVFRFTLPDSFKLEEKVTRAEDLQRQLTTAFPGYDVAIASQFGKVSREGMFEAAAGDVQTAQADAANYAEFTMEGAPL